MKIPRDKETNRKPNKNKEYQRTALGEWEGPESYGK